MGLLLMLYSCNRQGTSNPEQQATTPTSTEKAGQAFVDDDMSAKNILQIAISSPDHTTLVAGVQAAGLENVLVNAGPLTVFAPTNVAFDNLPDGVLSDLLKPENKSKLAGIITYHAAAGTYTMDDFTSDMMLDMATGDDVEVKVDGDQLTFNGAKVLASIPASNGIVHVVDAVLLPPSK